MTSTTGGVHQPATDLAPLARRGRHPYATPDCSDGQRVQGVGGALLDNHTPGARATRVLFPVTSEVIQLIHPRVTSQT